MKLRPIALFVLATLAPAAPSRAEDADSPGLSKAASAASTAPAEPSAPPPADIRPTGRTIGLGVSLFSPMGLAAKLAVTGNSGFQAGLGFGGHGTLSVHIDYVFTLAQAGGALGSVGPYLGGGLGMGFFGEPGVLFAGRSANTALALDAHGTFGVAWNVGDLPVDVFAELQAGVGVLPRFGLLGIGYLGVRYYFL